MRKEHQLVSFGLSNQLKEMELLQNGIFGWYQYKNNKPYANLKDAQNYCDSVAVFDDGYAKCPKEICDAPTVAELEKVILQALKHQYDFLISFSPNGGTWRDETFDEMYEVNLIDWTDSEQSKTERARTLPDVCAKVWICLKKEKII